MSWLSDLFGGGDEKTSTQTAVSKPEWVAAPELPEAKGARETWWSNLQDAGKSGTYGLNLPNYDNIYQNAANKINQYYWGGPSGGGLMDKIRAGAARRGVSDSPATDVLTQRMGAEQAGKLADMSANLDVTKADAIEKARQNWLNSIMTLSQMKPAGTWGGTNTTTMTQPQESLLPALLGGGISLAGNAMTNKTLENMNATNRSWMRDMYQTPKKTQDSLTGGSDIFGGGGMFDLGDFGSGRGEFGIGDVANLAMKVAPFFIF